MFQGSLGLLDDLEHLRHRRLPSQRHCAHALLGARRLPPPSAGGLASTPVPGGQVCCTAYMQAVLAAAMDRQLATPAMPARAAVTVLMDRRPVGVATGHQ